MIITHEGGRLYDVLTGERMAPGDKIIDTGILSRTFRPVNLYPTLYMKESTLVGLMEKAGYVVEHHGGNSSDAEVLVGEDVSGGGGASAVGEDPTGGSTTPAKRSNRKAKG